MTKRLLALAVAVVMMVSLFAGCAGGGGEIKIGAIQPISGKVSAYGTQSRDAINLAIKEINAKGGVLGKKLVSVVEDDEANAEKAKNAFTKLVTKDKVVGIIGALTSNCSLAINTEAQARKVVMITPSSTNEGVTLAGDYVFRACFIDPFQGDVNAKFAIENLKAKKAAVIFDNTNDYSKGLKDNFVKTFKAMGGEVIAEESYGEGDKDFNAQLTKIKGGNPDVLFIPDYYSTVALVAKQAKNQGITAIMLGGDGWAEISGNAGDEVVGSYFSNHYTPDADDAEVKAFVEAYKKEYNAEPNALAALAYDATYILADAIAKAGSTKSDAIKNAVAATNKKYVTGTVKYDENRNPVKSAVMVEVKKVDGKLKEVYSATVNP
jgi:branched-chain amino acid transport system substrate-binding protein